MGSKVRPAAETGRRGLLSLVNRSANGIAILHQLTHRRRERGPQLSTCSIEIPLH
jgi:hypothetical protein